MNQTLETPLAGAMVNFLTRGTSLSIFELVFMSLFVSMGLIVLFYMAPRRFRPLFSTATEQFHGSLLQDESEEISKTLNFHISREASSILMAIEELGERLESRPLQLMPPEAAHTSGEGHAIPIVIQEIGKDLQAQSSSLTLLQNAFHTFQATSSQHVAAEQAVTTQVQRLAELHAAKAALGEIQTRALEQEYRNLQASLAESVAREESRQKELRDTLDSYLALSREFLALKTLASAYELNFATAKTKFSSDAQSREETITHLKNLNAGLEAKLESTQAKVGSLTEEIQASRVAHESTVAENDKKNAELHEQITRLRDETQELNLKVSSPTSLAQAWKLTDGKDKEENTRSRQTIEVQGSKWTRQLSQEETLRVGFVEKYGEKTPWDGTKAIEHLISVLDKFEEGQFTDERPLTRRAVPWPICSDPRSFFFAHGIKKEHIEAFLEQLCNQPQVRTDKNARLPLLGRLKAVFHSATWTMESTLAKASDATGWPEIGALIFDTIEDALKQLSSAGSTYKASSPKVDTNVPFALALAGQKS